MAGVEFLWFMFKDLRPMLGAARIEAKAKKMQAAKERRTALSREFNRRENLRQVSIRILQNVKGKTTVCFPNIKCNCLFFKASEFT